MQHRTAHAADASALPTPTAPGDPPPFHPGPPLRIWEQLSDQQPTAIPPCQVGDLRLDPAQWRAWRAGSDLGLTRTEFALLWALATTPGQPWSRWRLIQEIWATLDTGNTNLVDVGIHRLRCKLEPDPAQPVYIRTVLRVGYLLNRDA
jgi:DNA-binding response OmpR family regulator